jgi:cell division transport system permease protein
MPFFVEGMTVGALAGAVASVVVGGGYYALLKWLEQPEAMWLDEFTRCMWSFQDIVWPLTLGFILFGMLIGSTGCATSIRRHLKV